MQSERWQIDEFFDKFGWIRCLRCSAPISLERRTLVLSCRHTFCVKCFQRGDIFECFPESYFDTTVSKFIQYLACEIIDNHRRIALCIICGKRARFTHFSENVNVSIHLFTSIHRKICSLRFFFLFISFFCSSFHKDFSNSSIRRFSRKKYRQNQLNFKIIIANG